MCECYRSYTEANPALQLETPANAGVPLFSNCNQPDHSAQLTAVRSVAWVGALTHNPFTPTLATLSWASWNR
jgi:hypothetical protein